MSLKKTLAYLSVLALLSVIASPFISRIAYAASTDTVSATVTAVIYSVSLDNADGIAFGSVAQGGTADTTTNGVDDSTTATNDGSVAAKLNIKGADFTGGAGWTLGAAAGSETYALKFCTATCDSTPSWSSVGINPSYATLVASVDASGTQAFDLQVSTPSTTTETTQQAITVTVQAVAP